MDAQLKEFKFQQDRQRADETVAAMPERRDQRLADAIHGSPTDGDMTPGEDWVAQAAVREFGGG